MKDLKEKLEQAKDHRTKAINICDDAVREHEKMQKARDDAIRDKLFVVELLEKFNKHGELSITDAKAVGLSSDQSNEAASES